jgi:vancomycin resistance protein VanW
MPRRTLSSYHPVLYDLRVKQRRALRYFADWRVRSTFAMERTETPLPHVLKRHQSLLRRKLGDSDPVLQENKVVNLTLAKNAVDGIIIEPNQTFSFWRLVGDANEEKGYLPGMRLSRGEVKVGVGGGLCQFANLLLWMAWHSPLIVSERHHHSFDPFPDEGRVLPFGSGASLFYPFLDIRFFNPTEQTFQFKIWLDETLFRGLLASDKPWHESFSIFEKNHAFIRKDEKIYRQNEIWRRVIDKTTGNTLREELLVKNFAEVKYEVRDLSD